MRKSILFLLIGVMLLIGACSPQEERVEARYNGLPADARFTFPDGWELVTFTDVTLDVHSKTSGFVYICRNAENIYRYCTPTEITE